MKTTSKLFEHTIRRESRLCLHISPERFQVPKVCMLNRECFHCAYDQWLDYMETDKKIEERSKVAGGDLALSA
jgi:hypothetical protein